MLKHKKVLIILFGISILIPCLLFIINYDTKRSRFIKIDGYFKKNNLIAINDKYRDEIICELGMPDRIINDVIVYETHIGVYTMKINSNNKIIESSIAAGFPKPTLWQKLIYLTD
jgi:hypothetical protein